MSNRGEAFSVNRIVAGVLLLSVVLLCGCGETELSGTLTEAGSTTVKPVADKIAAAFMDQHPRVVMETGGGGSGYGIDSVANGVVDIGAASRELKENEPELTRHLLGRDGIAIVVHPSCEVDSLTREQVVDIFTGAVDDWSALGAAPGGIMLVSREAGSGTRTAFEEMVMGEAAISADAVDEPSNGAVRTLVSTTPKAIGFLSLGYIDPTIKALAVDGVPCTIENCQSGEYSVVRPLYFLTAGQPDGLVAEFIEFSLGPVGQDIVESEGYLPVA